MLKRRDAIKMEEAKKSNAQAGPWQQIRERIRKGTLIPVVSNSFRIEQIFRAEETEVEGVLYSNEGATSTYKQLTQEWADHIRYPMGNGTQDLAQVAQYYAVNFQGERSTKDDDEPVFPYYGFLKSYLLAIPEPEPVYASIIDGLSKEMQETSFSAIATHLDYPRLNDNTKDPLHLLVDLPLAVYITTSQSDFLERALIAADKKPKTQICLWSERIKVRPEHDKNPDFDPTPDEPLVYHLFGLEEYPQSLVLSEGDYIDFLVSLAQNTNMKNPIIPSSLRMALAKSQMILLGYDLQDWDFRVLFKFIQKFERDKGDRGKIVIQVKPSEKTNLDALKKYLEDYVDISQFDIAWSDAEGYVVKLWNTYRGR